jgi:multisubunit Na+/H+ antiporter MnhE subunit
MHDQKITVLFSALLGFCMLAVMACTVWILFTGNTIELIMGILASAVSVYAFLDVSNDLN